ncbi:hypothetical protein JB92DRAFT_3278625 [Gautieria morchelliformis]|nr:hypothetical protein JB92DRAFT_3278625 [Gautieria morchelliformis]
MQTAASQGHAETVWLLLEAGADLNLWKCYGTVVERTSFNGLWYTLCAVLSINWQCLEYRCTRSGTRVSGKGKQADV